MGSARVHSDGLSVQVIGNVVFDLIIILEGIVFVNWVGAVVIVDRTYSLRRARLA